uniref:Tumor suppressor 2, mitochondrial calcium regulator n=1 Tax=Urocitellus parryii TaxID=9999 RepID=A0A8D2IJD4_UROPR
MGASGSKARGLWPFTSTTGGGGPEAAGSEQALVRPRGRPVPPFVFTRRGSMFYDEDGDLAHEFYEETIVTKNGQKRAKLRRVGGTPPSFIPYTRLPPPRPYTVPLRG